MKQDIKSTKKWHLFRTSVQEALDLVSFRDDRGRDFSPEEGFDLWIRQGLAVKKHHGCLYLIGNGASASMSSHFAADINKNAGIHTQVFTDPALMTAVGNDNSFSEIFALPLERRARPEDMLVTISSSGNSLNIVRAIEVAHACGLYVVTLTAMDQQNACRFQGHLNIYVPAHTYGIAETAHAALLHHWTDALVEAGKGSYSLR